MNNTPTSAPPAAAQHRPFKRGRLALALVVVALAIGLAMAWRGAAQTTGSASSASHTVAAVPVTAVRAQLRNVPVYLTALGNIQASNTVTVKTQVDGQLDSVNFAEGQDVKAGDVLAHIDPRIYQAQLEQAVAKKAVDEAQLENAKLNLVRDAALIKQNVVATETYDTHRALVVQLTAQVRLDQSAIDSAQTYLSYCTITSPIGGRTGARLVDQGNIVHTTDSTGLVVITQLQPISVLFSLPQQNLPALLAMQAKAPIKVSVEDRADGHLLDQGTVTLIDNQINQSTDSVPLKATFANEKDALWPGQFVNVRLLLRVAESAVTVPATAVQHGPNGLYVYGIKPDRTVEMLPVQVSDTTHGLALVASGLKAGDLVVGTGQYRLQPGTTVHVVDSAAGN